MKAKLVAFYLPQFHQIPENDKWWGDGFTEWVSVKAANPLFKGHNQPRRPLNNNYYDLSKKEVIEWQIDLAKSHGIYGFCHYHYWFDGKQLLEKPTNLFIDSKEINFKYCLAWANETWSRRWDGLDDNILQLQTHEPSKEKWGRHFDYLIKAWCDDRAIKINGRPVFVIYRPYKIHQLENMLNYWRERAHDYGLDGLCFLTMKQFGFPNTDYLKYFDGIIHFQPFEAMHTISSTKKDFKGKIRRVIPNTLLNILDEIHFQFRDKYGTPTIHDYEIVWQQIIKNSENADKSNYPGAFVDWDNTARYKKRATVFEGASPENFEFWLSKLIEIVMSENQRENYIFINAWNEWSEGTYLEPDETHDYDYLEAIKNTLKKAGESCV